MQARWIALVADAVSSKALLITAGWSLLLLIGFYALLRTRRLINLEHPVLWIVVIALAVRLFPDMLLPGGANGDMDAYEMVGQAGAAGQDIYAQPVLEKRHPYLPLYVYWLIFTSWFAQATGWSSAFIVRLPPILADAALAVLIYCQVRRDLSEGEAQRSGLLYALNPIVVLVSAYHGQFDAVPALFALLALQAGAAGVFTQAGFWLGTGILVKGWPVLALPTLFIQARSWRSKVWIILGATLIPLAALLVYVLWFNADPVLILKRALGYNHGVGVYGYTYFIRLGVLAQRLPSDAMTFLYLNARYITLVCLGVIWLWQARRQSLLESWLTILVAFLATTHAFSIQYLAWIVPFGLAARQNTWTWRYTLAAFIYMFLTYNTLILDFRIDHLFSWQQADLYLIIPASLPVWGVAVAWLIQRLRQPAYAS